MLRPRIIPCLLIKDKGLVKTINFTKEKYVGDPINAVKIFNEKLVDELMIIDIDASVNNQPPNFELIKKIVAESQMPISYTGGITNVEDVKKIISFGVEKIGISSGAINRPDLITESSEAVGSQSVVVVLDVKKRLFGGYSVFIENGKKDTGKRLNELAKEMIDRGAGELVVNSIDRDGTMQGYDHNIVNHLKEKISIPLTIIGGAGNLNHLSQLIESYGIIGAGVGSMFVFKGKYKAVLISYLSPEEKASLVYTSQNKK